MKRTFILLLMAAVAVWSYVVIQFVSGYITPNFASSTPQNERVEWIGISMRKPPLLDSSFRNPFQSYLYSEKPKPIHSIPQAPKANRTIVVIAPPTAVLGGVLWSDNPIAILKQGAQSELVKVGAEVFGFRVEKIERHQVTVVKEGRRFVLTY
jgi:hypothetical protein